MDIGTDMNMNMEKRQRLDAVFSGKQPDRPPVLGGWIAHPEALLEIAGASADEYRQNPQDVALRAYKKLDHDGLIGVFTTNDVDVYRCVNENSYIKSDNGMSFEEAAERVENLPEPDEYAKQFDFEAGYAGFKKDIFEMQKKCGDMVYLPANWSAGARASWYGEYGYENFFLLIGLRPDLGAKLFKLGGISGHYYSSLTAEAVKEGLLPKAVLIGEDICTQRGPMISAGFLQEHYAPALAYGLEPLLEAGCKPVWHCDGDARALIPMLLSCGIQGFQGFQPECGMHIEDIIKLRARDGNKLLIFGPFAVTTELPVLSQREIREKVRYYADICRDNADLVFFTANTINPDVPVENILAMYDEIKKYAY